MATDLGIRVSRQAWPSGAAALPSRVPFLGERRCQRVPCEGVVSQTARHVPAAALAGQRAVRANSIQAAVWREAPLGPPRERMDPRDTAIIHEDYPSCSGSHTLESQSEREREREEEDAMLGGIESEVLSESSVNRPNIPITDRVALPSVL